MKIPTYTYRGKTEEEVMKKARNELGQDAYILTIKKLKPKFWFLKFFKKDRVELTAIRKKRKEEKTEKKENKTIQEPTRKKEVVTKPKEDKKEVDEKTVEQNENANNISEAQKDKIIKNLEDKLDNLEGLLTKVMGKITANEQLVDCDSKRRYQSTILQLFYDNLIKNEVTSDIAEELLEGLDEMVEKEGKSINQLVSIVYDRIVKFIGEPKPIELNEDAEKPKIVAFIGPTGVGKTTTIAKLTADFMLNKKKKIALMTADTYRIAAVEQLKTYAEILGLNVEILYSIDEYTEKEKMLSDRDSIFIDTAGRSHKNEQRFEELKNLLNEIEKKEVYLVLSLATKYRDLVNIIKSYSSIADYKIIFTKEDETATLGSILNVRYITKKPLSYITFGQNVPDDIEVIKPEKIAKLLLGSFDE